MEQCSPAFARFARVTVDTPNVDRADVEYEMAVVRVSDGELQLSGPSEGGGRITPRIEISFPTLGCTIRLPAEGETAFAMGGTCDSGTSSGYVRVWNNEHDLVWEGGDPDCRYLWMNPRFQQRAVAESSECWDDPEPPPPECCCVTRSEQDVLLTLDDAEEVLMRSGMAYELEIEDARFVAVSQGGYATRDSPCSADATAEFGSAFLVRLAD